MTDFHTLYQTYAPLVRRFAVFLCGDPALADDITSDTFVRAWRSQEKIREVTVKAYLFAIARNLYRDHQRRQKPTLALHESLPDPALDLQVLAEQRAQVRELMLALQQFSLACIFWYVFWRARKRYALLPKRFQFRIWALFFTGALLCFIRIQDHKIVWFFLTDWPVAGAVIMVISVGLWIVFFVQRARELRQKPPG